MLGAQGERVRRPGNSGRDEPSSFSLRLWRGGWLFPHVRRQFLREKLLKNSAGCATSDSDERVFESQCYAIPVRCGVVEVREASTGEASENVRVVGLPTSIIALAND